MSAHLHAHTALTWKLNFSNLRCSSRRAAHGSSQTLPTQGAASTVLAQGIMQRFQPCYTWPGGSTH